MQRLAMIKSKQNPLQEEETLSQAFSSQQGQKLSLSSWNGLKQKHTGEQN
jgi:hypothetical protein